MRRILLTLVAAAVCAVASGCASRPAPPAAVNISGTVAVGGGVSQNGRDGEECAPAEEGYDDIHEGAQVVVTDAAGTTIALGRLDVGQLRRPVDEDGADADCVFSFKVSAPGGHRFYGVEVSHRGRLQYSAEQVGTPLRLTLESELS